jgi:hypothetical protein
MADQTAKEKKKVQNSPEPKPVLPPRYLGTSNTPMTAQEQVDNQKKSGTERLIDYYRRIGG